VWHLLFSTDFFFLNWQAGGASLLWSLEPYKIIIGTTLSTDSDGRGRAYPTLLLCTTMHSRRVCSIWITWGTCTDALLGMHCGRGMPCTTTAVLDRAQRDHTTRHDTTSQQNLPFRFACLLLDILDGKISRSSSTRPTRLG
jgi:hypothetical protein